MIKFRCLNCGQKIAVNDAGMGVEIDCPTCAGRLIVPPVADHEFRSEHFPSAPRAEAPTEIWRAAVLPHLARLMMDRLMQALLFQRREMLHTQNEVAGQIDMLEQRLTLLQSKLQRRMSYYGERVAQLQNELAAKEAENRELQLRIRELALIPSPLGHLPAAGLQAAGGPQNSSGQNRPGKLPHNVLVGA